MQENRDQKTYRLPKQTNKKLKIKQIEKDYKSDQDWYEEQVKKFIEAE